MLQPGALRKIDTASASTPRSLLLLRRQFGWKRGKFLRVVFSFTAQDTYHSHNQTNEAGIVNLQMPLQLASGFDVALHHHLVGRGDRIFLAGVLQPGLAQLPAVLTKL